MRVKLSRVEGNWCVVVPVGPVEAGEEGTPPWQAAAKLIGRGASAWELVPGEEESYVACWWTHG